MEWCAIYDNNSFSAPQCLWPCLLTWRWRLPLIARCRWAGTQWSVPRSTWSCTLLWTTGSLMMPRRWEWIMHIYLMIWLQSKSLGSWWAATNVQWQDTGIMNKAWVHLMKAWGNTSCVPTVKLSPQYVTTGQGLVQIKQPCHQSIRCGLLVSQWDGQGA